MLVSEAVYDIKHQLYGSIRTEKNRLQQELSATASIMQLDFPAQGASRGAFLEVGEEIVYSWGATTSGSQSVQIARGEFGTTPAVHPVGTTVEVNPRFPVARLLNTMRDEIRSWPEQIFGVKTFQLGVVENNWTYLDGIPNLIRPLRFSHVDDKGRWTEVRNWRMTKTLPSASGEAIGVELFNLPANTHGLGVLAAVGFDLSTFTMDTDLQSDVGLASSMLDLLSIGTTWRVFSTREIQRTFIEAQGDSRRAEETPPTHITQTARTLERMRDARLQEEQQRLVSEYGWRQR